MKKYNKEKRTGKRKTANVTIKPLSVDKTIQIDALANNVFFIYLFSGI